MKFSKQEYEKLVEEVRKHDRLYFVECKPSISDFDYDQLVEKLKKIEKTHPDWVLPTSPTQRLQPALTGGFKQVAHSVPMLSLANTYSEAELGDFIKRVQKLVSNKKVSFCAELKMDGVAVAVRYEKGVYVRAMTRGDGWKGDDITANMRTIRSLPLKLTGEELPDVLEIRGEVFMSHKVFQKLNEEKQAAGEELWANPRNAAAGSLKLLDPKVVAQRFLSVVFYGIAEDSSHSVETQSRVHQCLKKWGLPVFNEEHWRHCDDLEPILQFADKIEAFRSKFPFDIDGIVVKVEELRYHQELGVTGKSPRYAVAYKFAPEQATTRIHAITVQVGRTGVLTPVAELDPVFLAGSTIARATLHNQEEVERKDIRVGDSVVIEKGGDVIPKVVEVIKSKRPEGTHPWKMPKRCPACGTFVVHSEEEVAVRCPNLDCPEQKIRRIAYFASKDAMDINHLGDKVVEQLVNKGLVNSVSDIYALTPKELSQLDGFKEKSIQNLLNSIDASREVTLDRLILGLGIKYIGEGTAELLAAHVGDLEGLAKMNIHELQQIEGIGGKMAQAIVDYFKEPAHIKEIHSLLKRGIRLKSIQRKVIKGHQFFGKTFVLTGTLKNYTRDQATGLIKERGGKVVGSLSRSTDYLLVGADPGSKLEKAQTLKVPLLSEEQFEKLL